MLSKVMNAPLNDLVNLFIGTSWSSSRGAESESSTKKWSGVKGIRLSRSDDKEEIKDCLYLYQGSI